jgi:aerobic carbon-monoxide dehydrogenase large subunit
MDAPNIEKYGASQGIGASAKRVEDLRFVRGLGRYTDDHVVNNAVHMIVLRSPYANAYIRGIDTTDAKATPGVLAVLTGADALADGLGIMRSTIVRPKRDGSAMATTDYRMLATDRAMFVGDAVAIVIGETKAAAQDGADAIAVDYDGRPSVTDVVEAMQPDAPQLWPDTAAGNIAFVHTVGNKAKVEESFAAAAHVAKLDFRISRLNCNAMEPRNALGIYDIAEERYTLVSGTQAPHATRNLICEQVLGIQTHRLRVISNDVGGGFGMKGGAYPEQVLVLWAAKKVGRPVRWTATRSESMLSDYHCRDNVSTIELALDATGNFLAVRIVTLAALGAYMACPVLIAPIGNLGSLAGTYTTPYIYADVTGVLTNTQPTSPYRGAGRPEATYALERIIDIAADEMGLDRIEIRRRNLIPASAMPYQTGLVFKYDSGEFEKNMDLALEAADWAGFPARRAETESRGKLRGISVINAIEIAGGPPKTPMDEGAELRFDGGGNLAMVLGSHNHGQGHETVFRQIANSLLGVDPARTRVLFGDTDLVFHGRGTFGSRTMSAGGTAVALAARKIIERGKTLAGMLLEADAGDIEFDAGFFRVAGTDRAVRIEDVAKVSYTPGKFPPGTEIGLTAQAMVAPQDATFPNGCHIVEVEVDPETGVTEVVRYTVVDDCGVMINPMLVKGQVHGGIAQGLSQVLFERVEYEAGTGQIVTGSFTDYAMPRADDLPSIEVETNPVPTPVNALGAKGAGEAGTVGALPGVMNALIDALKPYKVRHIDMPATGEAVWRAINQGA